MRSKRFSGMRSFPVPPPAVRMPKDRQQLALGADQRATSRAAASAVDTWPCASPPSVELSQTVLSNRDPAARDVLLNFAAFSLAQALWSAWRRWRPRRAAVGVGRRQPRPRKASWAVTFSAVRSAVDGGANTAPTRALSWIHSAWSDSRSSEAVAPSSRSDQGMRKRTTGT